MGIVEDVEEEMRTSVEIEEKEEGGTPYEGTRFMSMWVGRQKREVERGKVRGRWGVEEKEKTDVERESEG